MTRLSRPSLPCARRPAWRRIAYTDASFGGCVPLSLPREGGRTLMVCHTHRYRSAIRGAKQRIVSGELTPHRIISRYVFLRRENKDWQGRARSWTDNLLWHHGCHATDLCLWLLGVTD